MPTTANRFITGKYAHALSDGGVLLEEQVNVNVDVGGSDAPNHATDNLVKLRQAADARAEVTRCEKELDDLHKQEPKKRS